MTHYAKVAAIGMIGLLCGCAAKDARVQELKTAQDLKVKMDAKQVRVIHALDADSFAKGHIPGAENIDYEKMTLPMLPSAKDEPMVFYCVGGMCPVGRMAANKAAQWGYTNVWVYEGGMKDWQASGMQVAKGK